MAGRLEGKTAIVTGAGSGIGRGVACRFGAEGALVVVNDLNGSAAKETVDAICGDGGQAEVHEGDITSSAVVDALVEQAVAITGRLDVMHNNAGGQFSTELITEMSNEDWAANLALNLTAVFYGIRAALRAMIPQGRGSIISTSSLSGLGGMARSAGYAAAKAGIVQLIKSAAIECAHTGVRINAIAPGTMHTPALEAWMEAKQIDLADWATQIPQGRVGEPTDIAGAALFLATDDSSYINGVTIPVDGGVMAKLGGPHPE